MSIVLHLEHLKSQKCQEFYTFSSPFSIISHVGVDSSTLGALQIPKVSIVLHFQHLNLTGDVVGGPGGRSRSVPALIFPEDVVGWGAAHPMSRAKSDNSSTL